VRNGRTKYLPIHKIRSGEDYYIGFFLIGAYQEILGDMHNLFGDTKRGPHHLQQEDQLQDRYGHQRATPPGRA